MDINLHPGWEREIERNPAVEAATERAADVVVEDAQDRAPKASGESAATIHHEQVEQVPPTFRVSWTPDKFWLRFHEEGTEHQPARPFLRPAADAPSHRNE